MYTPIKAMKKIEIEYLEPIRAIEVDQNEYKFYVFTIKAKALLDISYTSERTKSNRTGIQRGLREDRLASIGKYIKGEIAGNPVLPNSLIVSLSNDSFYENEFINIANKKSGEAFIIDGQHRLWSFEKKYSNDSDLNIVVSAFLDLEDEKKALIFKTINGEQRKINPSLVYDLIPMLRNKSWVEFENWRSQEIVSFLNEFSDSPWANKISMVGEPGKIISQSSFMTAIKKLFKKGHIFDSENSVLVEAVLQENLLLVYFKAIQKYYSVEWDNKEYLLCKYIGVSALLNLLEVIIKDIQKNDFTIVDDNGLVIQEHMFYPYMEQLRIYNFSTIEAKKEGKSYVGEAGVTELFKKIASIVKL